MKEEKTQEQINEINRKLDIILEEIELQKRSRREMEDLKDDLTRVGKDFYESAVVELEELHDHFNPKDALHLGKKLLRNVNTFNAAIEQMESMKDFLTDASPLIREYAIDFMAKLDEMDRKGYFGFAKELQKIADNVTSSFTQEDLKNLGDNVVTMLNTVKNLTQPDMLQTINTAVDIYKKLDIEIKEDVSLFSLIKEMNTPEVKKGLAFGLKFLKSIAAPKTNENENIKQLQS